MLSTSASIVVAIVIAALSQGEVADPKPISIVDYMKLVKLDSGFENRKKLYIAEWPSDPGYKGTAPQNLKLLEALLAKAKQVRIPFASKSIDNCDIFYKDPTVAVKLTAAFQGNAITACIVTGTSVPHENIRIKLQEEYRKAKPANGSSFTSEEHKAIHDRAYKAAGCTEASAGITGWIIVDKMALPATVVDLAIKYFGKCTVKEEK